MNLKRFKKMMSYEDSYKRIGLKKFKYKNKTYNFDFFITDHRQKNVTFNYFNIKLKYKQIYQTLYEKGCLKIEPQWTRTGSFYLQDIPCPRYTFTELILIRKDKVINALQAKRDSRYVWNFKDRISEMEQWVNCFDFNISDYDKNYHAALFLLLEKYAISNGLEVINKRLAAKYLSLKSKVKRV